jgi:hypothetical protein
MRATALVIAAALAAAPALAGGAGARPDANGRLSCTAFAVSTGGMATPSGASTVDIVVERWSGDADRQRLTDALKKGQDALLDALRDLPRVGYIRTPGNVGWELHYAHQAAGEDGGRRVVIATDRPMDMWEIVNRPRTVDYPFTFIEMRLDDDGKGEGKLSLATQVTASSEGRFVYLENYEAQPVLLNQVSCKR